jgi:hypothetical protein
MKGEKRGKKKIYFRCGFWRFPSFAGVAPRETKIKERLFPSFVGFRFEEKPKLGEVEKNAVE